MTSRRVIRRRRARQDVDEAALWYASEADLATAESFVAAVETALRHIARHPETGSLRYAEFGPQPGLRFWPLRTFPWWVFHRVHAERIDVVRLLHAERDIPHWLRDQE